MGRDCIDWKPRMALSKKTPWGHGRWVNELGVTALGHTHLLYLKLPERKLQDAKMTQYSYSLASLGGGGGCGLHFPSSFTSKYEAEGIIPNPEGRPHPSRSIRFPRFQKKSLHLTWQTVYLTLTCLPVWSSVDSKTQGGMPVSLQVPASRQVINSAEQSSF